MALAVTARGTGTHNTGATSFGLAPASNCTAGARVVLKISADNSSSGGTTNDFTTVTDSLGNTWTKRQSPVFDNGVASAGIQGAIFDTAQDVGTLTTGSTITVNFGSSPVAKTWTLDEITAAAGSRAEFRTGADKSAGATGTAATLGASPTVNIGEALVATVYMESGTTQTCTGDSDVTNGSWTTLQYTEIGSTTSGTCIASQCKIQTTANSTQSYDITLGLSSDYHGSYAIYTETQISSSGTSSVTFGALTDSATGTVVVAGTASNTFGALTASATGTVGISGALSSTFGALTVTADGTVSSGGPVADANITFGALTTTSTGKVDISGSASNTFGALTTTSTGKVDISGSASRTFGALTTTSTGKVDISGSASTTFGALTTASTGKVDISGSASRTFGALTTTGTGTIAISGLANITFGALTITASGGSSAAIDGAANITLGALTVSSAGKVDISGTASRTFGALTTSATGKVDIAGISAAALGALTSSATGKVDIKCSSNATLGLLTVIGTGLNDSPVDGPKGYLNSAFAPLTITALIQTDWLTRYITAGLAKHELNDCVEVQSDGTTLHSPR